MAATVNGAPQSPYITRMVADDAAEEAARREAEAAKTDAVAAPKIEAMQTDASDAKPIKGRGCSRSTLVGSIFAAILLACLVYYIITYHIHK